MANTLPQPAPSRARTLEAGERWARLAQARAASRPGLCAIAPGRRAGPSCCAFTHRVAFEEGSGPRHSLKAAILRHSTFFMVQLSHPYMTTGKTIALTIWTFIGKVMSLLFNMLSRLVITFLPRSKRLLISWLQSPSAVILEPQK